MDSEHRITLIASQDDHYTFNRDIVRRLAFIDSRPLRPLVMAAVLAEPMLDAERLIIDRTASAEMFLDLLAALPHQFGGDVLRIDEGGRGHLSAAGRGGDRVLYVLDPDDVHFYLRTHGLERIAIFDRIDPLL